MERFLKDFGRVVRTIGSFLEFSVGRVIRKWLLGVWWLFLLSLSGFWGAFWVSWAAAGAPGAPFWSHFGGLGVLWGSILGVWGCP